jgi:hypothetical protein
MIHEVFISASDSCQARAPGVLGPAEVTPNGVTGTWTVGMLVSADGITTAPKNVYGIDYVGWKACPIEAYRCAGVTMPRCGIQLMQGLEIHSPADQPKVFAPYVPPKINQLAETINGYIIAGYPVGQPNNPLVGIGVIQSQRGNGSIRGMSYVSNKNSCLDSPKFQFLS